MNLDEFKQEFQKLRNKGFVPSLRNGSTGIGYTFEKLLGLNPHSARHHVVRKKQYLNYI